MPRRRLFLIDSFGFIFRAYHARARSGAPPMRTSTGLATEAVYIFHNMLRKLQSEHKPDYLAAVMESEGPTFRDEQFTEYKANRAAMPEDLGEQISAIGRLLDVMRISRLQFPGFEADDVIGTIARQAETGVDVVIVSSDKDMLQLVDERISMLNPAKDNEWYDPAKVEQFLGVPPGQVADLLALKGDAVDNIPGAPGIGDKGARDIITRFGSVEAALDGAAGVERKMYRESLQNNRQQILLSKRLATIDTAVPVAWKLEDLAAREPDLEPLRTFYREMEFFSLLRGIEPAAETSAGQYRRFESPRELDEWMAAVPAGVQLGFALRSGGEGELGLGTVGLSVEAGHAVSFPADWLERLRGVLEDGERVKIAHDVKAILGPLADRGIEPRGFTEDIMLYAFLVSADSAACALDALVERHLKRKLGATAEQHAEAVVELWKIVREEVVRDGVEEVYRTIDLPLMPVLSRMERCGIRIDPDALRRLSVEMDGDIQRLTSEIHQLAGHPFNINSPQQLAKVLFEELQLPAPARSGKAKAPSTAADVLEALAPRHEIVSKVLDYRQLAKLKGTYVDALPLLIGRADGRLHTTFNQIGAATGRLSSVNPNLQNIPIRTEQGREIRAAFVPREGWQMLVADYSQIELRLLAHMSLDPVLLAAFRHGEDIHTRTASEVFGVGPLMVTPEMRRNAKAVNFGIVYGQTPFGLAAQLGIDRKEAESYIRHYFDRYQGVKVFIDRTIAEVRQSGVARTMFGRVRPIPDINSKNPGARGFAERTAVNTPLQGTAADLIKLAMIHIDGELRKGGWQARMLLQVHDELVFEAPEQEMDDLRRLVKSAMETVHKLEVPLLVDTGVGSNWRDAK
ncbi:MAG: DNA polymerase I [Bryobacterales bacterium]|nr:DNA polymerase I [Bryobacterales bacterium]